MPFQKGVSGNPAGRPRSGEALADYIRQVHGEDARRLVDTLGALISDHSNIRARICVVLHEAGLRGQALAGTEDRLYDIVLSSHVDLRAMLSAIGILLERGYGKPPPGD